MDDRINDALMAWHQHQQHPTDDACVWQVQGGTHLVKASHQPSHLHSNFQLYCETTKQCKKKMVE
jgi:hypothetical protein